MLQYRCFRYNLIAIVSTTLPNLSGNLDSENFNEQERKSKETSPQPKFTYVTKSTLKSLMPESTSLFTYFNHLGPDFTGQLGNLEDKASLSETDTMKQQIYMITYSHTAREKKQMS